MKGYLNVRKCLDEKQLEKLRGVLHTFVKSTPGTLNLHAPQEVPVEYARLKNFDMKDEASIWMISGNLIQFKINITATVMTGPHYHTDKTSIPDIVVKLQQRFVASSSAYMAPNQKLKKFYVHSIAVQVQKDFGSGSFDRYVEEHFTDAIRSHLQAYISEHWALCAYLSRRGLNKSSGPLCELWRLHP